MQVSEDGEDRSVLGQSAAEVPDAADADEDEEIEAEELPAHNLKRKVTFATPERSKKLKRKQRDSLGTVGRFSNSGKRKR